MGFLLSTGRFRPCSHVAFRSSCSAPAAPISLSIEKGFKPAESRLPASWPLHANTMKLSSIVSAYWLAATAAAVPALVPRADAEDQAAVAELTDSIRASILAELDEREEKLAKRGEAATCHARNVVFRRE